MKPQKTLSLVAAIATLGFATCGVAQAASTLLIDDFNFTGATTIADDQAANGVAVTASRNTGGGYIGSPAARTTSNGLWASLFTGDQITTEDCSACQQGHFTNSANSRGQGYWLWNNFGSMDLSGYETVDLQFATDVAGGDMIVSFSKAGSLVDYVHVKDLGSTGLVLTDLSLDISGLTGLGDIDDIRIDLFSVGTGSLLGVPFDDQAAGFVDVSGYFGTLLDGNPGNGELDLGAGATGLDLNLDNPGLRVPEPTTVAMMGLGLVGLWRRGRRRA